jgi:hypothetical protein
MSTVCSQSISTILPATALSAQMTKLLITDNLQNTIHTAILHVTQVLCQIKSKNEFFHHHHHHHHHHEMENITHTNTIKYLNTWNTILNSNSLNVQNFQPLYKVLYATLRCYWHTLWEHAFKSGNMNGHSMQLVPFYFRFMQICLHLGKLSLYYT